MIALPTGIVSSVFMSTMQKKKKKESDEKEKEIE